MTNVSKIVGYRGITKQGCPFEVIGKGTKSTYFIVKFTNGYEVEVAHSNIKRGCIKNHFHPSVCGVGYFGIGDFSSKVCGKITREYSIWGHMIKRCYSEAYQVKKPTYIGCSVAEEWHCFQNFADWITKHSNWNKGYHLDKDLKVMGNKIYSPDTCDLIPCQVNDLLNVNAVSRGESALGVHWHKASKKYSAHCCLIKKDGESIQTHLGLFNTEEEAFFAYKKAKETNIKFVANIYKSEICDDIYKNLMRYEIPTPTFTYKPAEI